MNKLILSAVIISILVIANFYFSSNDSVSTALEWSCMEPLPNDAINIKVGNGGSAFTREFTISFTASKSEIENWVKRSNGTQASEIKFEGDIAYYYIKPCAGALYARISINWATLKVYLRTYWS